MIALQSAPSDLFDDSGVIQIGFAVGQTRFDEVDVYGGQWKWLADPICDITHQLEILKRLGDLGMRGKVVSDHFVSPVVHRSRIGGRSFQDLEEGGKIEAHRLGESQSFGHDSSVEAAYQVDGQLCPAPSTDWPEIIAARAYRIQDRRDRLHGLRVTPDESDTIATGDLIAIAGECNFEKVDTAAGDAFGKHGYSIRIASTRADHNLPGRKLQR